MGSQLHITMEDTYNSNHTSTQAKGTCFVFTSWDYPTTPLYNDKTMRYLVYKPEKAPETGALHYQGYVQMWCQMRERAVQKELTLNKGWCKASTAKWCEQARAYCYKLESGIDIPVSEYGEFHPYEQGKRNDIAAFVHDSKTKPKREMYMDHPACMVKYRNAYMDIRATFTEPRTWKTVVHVIYGPSNTGKSYACRNTVLGKLEPNTYYTMGIENNGWWDGYDNHKIVLIEDFKGWLMPGVFLQIADEYPCTVNVKGSRAQFVATDILINTTLHPSLWWNNEVLKKTSDKEIYRRIDNLYYKATLESQLVREEL